MYNKLAIAIIVLAGFITSCNRNRVEVINGVRIQYHNHGESKTKTKLGDIIIFDLVIKNQKDSVLKSSIVDGAPATAMIQAGQFKGSFEDAMVLFVKGDSATVLVPVDSLAKGMPQLPPFLKKGEDVKFTVKVNEVFANEAAYKKYMDAQSAGRKGIDAKIIDDYVAKNKIANVKSTASGLKYIITTPGTGANIAAGDSAVVKYSGQLTSGKVFDANTFPLQVGMGSVIPGWDEGLQLFNQGAKGKLFIPSPLAYGPNAQPNLPANSVLIFDIEIVKVTKKK